MHEAHTLGVSLNVLGDYVASVPEGYRDTPYVFLANDHPRTQLGVVEAMAGEPFVVADTRDFWIAEEPEALEAVLQRVHGLVLNDGEARMLTREDNLVRAGQRIRERGPAFCVVKKGEHGALLFSEEGIHALPAFPLDAVRDPTGAGDAFAGGLMGYLASSGKRSREAVRRGRTYGTVAASVAVQGFSVQPFRDTSRDALNARHDSFLHATRF